MPRLGKDKMGKVMVVALVGMVLISFASAALVDFLSNTVTGEVEVRGPVFYLDRTDIMSDGEGKYLKLNDDDVEGTYFKLDSNKFYSDSLGVDGFYPMDFEVNLVAKVFDLPRNETTDEVLEFCSVDVTVYRVSNRGGSPEKLCSVINLGMDNEEGYEEYVFTCLGIFTEEIDFTEDDRFELLLVEQCPSDSYVRINLKGDSYIQAVVK